MAQRTLIIGLGSTGMRICEEVLKRVEGEFGSLERAPWLRAIAFETEQQAGSYMGQKGLVYQIGVSEEDYGPMVEFPASFQGHNEFMDWHDAKTMSASNASSDGAGNVRMIGRATFLHPDSFAVFDEHVEQNLHALSPEEMTDQAAKDARGRLPDGTNPDVNLSKGVRVFVVGTLTGGTCSGSFIDVGYYIRTMPGMDVRVVGMFGIPHPSLQAKKGGILKANAYSALRELNHFHQDGVQYRAKFPTRGTPTLPPKGTRPYHSVFILQPRTGQVGAEQLITSSVAQFLYLSAVGNLGDAVAGDMINPATVYAQLRDREGNVTSYNTLGVSVIEYPAVHILRGCAARLASEAVAKWTSNLPPEPGPTTQLILNALRLERGLVSEELKRAPANTDAFQIRIERAVSAGSQGAREGDVPALGTSESAVEAGFRHDRNGSEAIPAGVFKDAIAANGEALVQNRTALVREFFGDAIRDAERGPLWVQKFAESLRSHLSDWRSSVTAGPEAQGASADVASHRLGMDDAALRLNDAQRSFMVGAGLIYRRTARNKGADDYHASALAYWEARLQEACEPAIRKLCNGLIELCELTIQRIAHPQYGMERWAGEYQSQLAALHATIDSTAPLVNGVLLFDPGKTVGAEYERRLKPLKHRGAEDRGIAEAYTGTDYAIRRLVRSWDWVAAQLLANEPASVFDEPRSDDRRNRLKPVESKEIEGLVDLARPFFREILNVKAVDQAAESELEGQVKKAFEMSAPFLEINDSHMSLPKPTGKGDRRLPRFAFYKGAETARDAPDTPEGIVWKTVQKETMHFKDLSEPHRIVFVQARATFSLVSINGLDPLKDMGFRDDYDAEARSRQVHARVGGIRWKTMDNRPEVANAPLLVARFLAGIAFHIFQGAGETPFTMEYAATRPGGNHGVLRTGHELEDAAYVLGTNEDASFALQRKLEEAGAVYRQVSALDDFSRNVGIYRLTFRGEPVDGRLAVALLAPYVSAVPGLNEAWRAQYGGAPSLDDYLYDAPNGDVPGAKPIDQGHHPVPGYYCPTCHAFLAQKDQASEVPKACKGCGTPLLAA